MVGGKGPGPARAAPWVLAATVGVLVLASLWAVPSGPHGAGPITDRAAPSAGSGHSAVPSARAPALSFPSIPPGAVGSLNLTVYNPGPNATGTYAQPVAINSSRYASLINSNWSNGLAAYASNGTPVYAWIQSGASNASTGTLLWLRLGSIGPLARTNVSFYFWPKTAFNLSEGGYLGENPGLSPQYAEWDNGWRVFDTYENFSGTTLPARWTALGSWAGAVRDGLTVSAVYSMGAIEAPLGAFASRAMTVETYARMNGTASPLCLFVAGAPGFSGQYQFFPSAYALDAGANGTSNAVLRSSNSTAAPRSTTGPTPAPVDFAQAAHVIGLTWNGTNATETGSVNGIPFVVQTNATGSSMAEFGVGEYCDRNCSTWNVSWVRARSVPDPMPLVSNGGFSPIGVAVATSPLETDVGHPVTFTCRAAGAGAPFNYTWSFGDSAHGGGAVVPHSYAMPGTYTSSCSVVGSSGVSGNSTATVVIRPTPAILLFQALPSAFTLGETLNLVTNISGGTGPFTYAYVGLPPGCPERNTSTFSCLPGVTGTFAIEVIVEDIAHESTAAWITISVTAPTPPANASSFSAVEGYAIAGAVAGAVVLAGVIPVMLWNRHVVPPPPPARPPATARVRTDALGPRRPEGPDDPDGPDDFDL